MLPYRTIPSNEEPKTLMSKLQVNDLSPVKDSLALRDQINDLTEDQAENIVGGWSVSLCITISG
jgi:hypothetical protein